MIILSWNCRGLGHPVAIPYLCELVKAHRPDILFLCETLSYSVKVVEMRARLFYNCACTVNCIGRSSGLCILWKPVLLCSITSFSQNHVDVCVSDPEGDWRLTGFYSCPEASRRRDSWSLLRRLLSESNLHWLVIGVFNDILTGEEKKGGRPRQNWLLNGFRETVLDCNIFYVSLTGYPFTWSRRKNNHTRVEE